MIGFEISRDHTKPEYWVNFLYQIQLQTGEEYEYISQGSIQQELNKYNARYHYTVVLGSKTKNWVEFEDEKQLLLFVLRYS
jgi:hypothetical protein